MLTGSIPMNKGQSIFVVPRSVWTPLHILIREHSQKRFKSATKKVLADTQPCAFVDIREEAHW